ncbi:MAG: hypothetical protein K0R16_1079, partial [Nitrososphaeraceae archaeon]|nr:hypothetical protein [Nitrososphaeraceae archaeon]
HWIRLHPFTILSSMAKYTSQGTSTVKQISIIH